MFTPSDGLSSLPGQGCEPESNRRFDYAVGNMRGVQQPLCVFEALVLSRGGKWYGDA